MTPTEIILLITSSTAFIVSIYTAISARKKTFAETDEIVANVAKIYKQMSLEQAFEINKQYSEFREKMISLREKLIELEDRVAVLTRIIEKQDKGISTLLNQIKLAGKIPDWIPEENVKGEYVEDAAMGRTGYD